MLFGPLKNKILGNDSKTTIQKPWCALETVIYATYGLAQVSEIIYGKCLGVKALGNDILKGYHTCFDCNNNLPERILSLTCGFHSEFHVLPSW